MGQPLIIATAHSRISRDVRANGADIRAMMIQAHAKGARMIHFPEGAVSGYVKTQVVNWRDVDWSALQEELEATAALAAQLSIWVAVGANHRLNPPHRPHNSIYVISDQGTLAGRYDKRLCSNTEITDWYSPGIEPFTFDIDGIRFGCAICIELSFAKIFSEYRRRGVHCILLSSYSNDSMDEIKARGHAAVHNIWLSMARPTNPQPPVFSAIYGPDGSIVAQTKDHEPSLVTAVLDLNDERWQIPLNCARPWRETALAGKIYNERRANDARSTDKLSF